MDAKEYAALPYTRLIQEVTDETGHYFYGRIMEIDGCQSTGQSAEEVYEGLSEALEGNISVRIENHMDVPVPKELDHYSGRFMVRIPKSLHRKLVQEANTEGISLNQLVLYKLSM